MELGGRDAISRGGRVAVIGLLIPGVVLVSCTRGRSAHPRDLTSPTSSVRPKTTALRPPADLTAEAKNGGQVSLTWSPGAGPITGYTIYRDGTLLKFISPALSTYLDITVQSRKTYRYEMDSAGPAGRSPRSTAAEVTTPAAPRLALAQVTGYYALLMKVVELNFTNWQRGQQWGTFWQFLPVCSSDRACDVTTTGDGEREATLKRSKASYSGKILLPRFADCSPARTDAIDTVRFKVTRGRFIKGVWTAVRLRGTVRREVPPSHGCLYGYAIIQFRAMWDSPPSEA